MKFKTERDQMKHENRARLKKFAIAIDKAAHGDYGGKVSIVNECAPMAISTLAVVAVESLRF